MQKLFYLKLVLQMYIFLGRFLKDQRKQDNILYVFLQHLKRTDVKVSSVPHIEGLSVQDFLNYAREHPNHLRYLPDERDWVHLDKQWICDVLFTIDTENIQSMIDDAIKNRNQKIEKNQNLTIQIKPEFAAALESCLQFSSKIINFPLNFQIDDKGRSVFLLKDSSKRKRSRIEIEEVHDEEEMLKENKQEYLKMSKRLKTENEELQKEVEILNNQQQVLNQLIEVGIINQNGEIVLQPQFNI